MRGVESGGGVDRKDIGRLVYRRPASGKIQRERLLEVYKSN